MHKVKKATVGLAAAAALVVSGCVSISIPEDLPESTNINVEVYLSGYKSAAGYGNLLEVKTDATLPLLGANAAGADNEHTDASR